MEFVFVKAEDGSLDAICDRLQSSLFYFQR